MTGETQTIYLGLCTVHTEPGHRVVQAIFWTLWPSQKAPPLSGAGLVQVLVRFWKPLPHRLLHTDHSVQVDQPPFTEKQERKYDCISKPSWSAQRCLRLWVMLLPRAVTTDGWEEHEKQHWTDTNPCLQRTKCTAFQKSLYKSKKYGCWMKNTIWWLLELAGDLPSPENQPDPALST